MRAFFLIAVVFLGLTGCQSPLKPGLSLNDAKFAEGPMLIQRGDRFYLRYRRALEPKGPTLLSLLQSKKVGDAAYYYFSTPVSHTEWGNLIERPLAYDGYEELAEHGRIFWLDPNGKTHVIPIQKE
ncbi:MAG: hypothetical protein QOD03_751 [Verrucomicrobiota bacterium]|jgi:hypothetical protein